MDKKKIIFLLKTLVESLVNKEYSTIEKRGESGEYNAEELKDLVEEYGGIITTPPEEDYNNINIIKIESEPEYAIEYELWVDNEKSDLTLSANIRFNESERKITIENIHVL